jgi:DNA sulfur modification protein DndD
MILERLILHDFGVYRGRQEIELSPLTPGRPIILIGARNGRGKTTLLDAINLVLYGSRANLSNRLPKVSWEDYLRSSIHKSGATSASVSLHFSVVNDFGVRAYHITRSWIAAPKGVNESFSVVVNGERDDVLADDWSDHLEGLLPLEIASLNFFDGERTNELATPEKSKEVIRSAIRGLLGLGILERLEADLKVLIRRKQDLAIGGTGSEVLRGAQEELDALTARRTALVQEVAGYRTALERSKEELKRHESLAREVGVERWEQRTEIESEISTIRAEQVDVEQQLQIAAAGVAPLAIAEALLARTDSQVQADQSLYRERLLLEMLYVRDSSVLEQLPIAVREVAKAVLLEDQAARRARVGHTAVHVDAEQLREQVRSTLDEIAGLSDLGTLISRFDLLETRMADAERKLMGVPTDAQLAPVLETLGQLREQVATHDRSLVAGEEELQHLVVAVERQESKVASLRQSEADKMSENIQDRRSRDYATKALGTLEGLAKATITRNVAAIEDSILRSFKQLIGKTELITRVRLDPESLEMSVDTHEGDGQPIERLSAGERQLLAVAILWGLSQIAQRDVPLVVDTPLGRLDGFHRERLARNYFPSAAHQVVILSTDEEFDSDLRVLIEPFISREYLIEFVEEEHGSRITPGYFVGVTA